MVPEATADYMLKKTRQLKAAFSPSLRCPLPVQAVAASVLFPVEGTSAFIVNPRDLHPQTQPLRWRPVLYMSKIAKAQLNLFHFLFLTKNQQLKGIKLELVHILPKDCVKTEGWLGKGEEKEVNQKENGMENGWPKTGMLKTGSD